LANELALLADARSSLERARSLGDVKAILDVAVAAKRYAEAKKLGEESLAYAQEIINRATRRMGEMLTETPKNEGGRPPKTPSTLEGVSPPTLSQLGITETASHRAQQLARIPEAVFEESVAKPQNRLLRVAREAAADERRAQPTDPQTVHGLVDIRHGDFRDVLAGLSDVDAIITDPPYPKEFIPLFGDLSALASKVLKPSGVLVAMTGQWWIREYLDELSRHLSYRWTAAYVAQGARTRVHAARVGTGWKPLLVFQRQDAEGVPFLVDDLFDAASQTHDGVDKQHHHWGQSESGIAEQIERFTVPGALVVDPFLGGGTTAVVCRDLGRRFIGCDVDAAAVATSRERLG
jgi:site-specific DNA-methyltransferase (adenine-specific)